MGGDLVLVSVSESAPRSDSNTLTGATGAIGFRILIQLLEAGYRVRAAVRSESGFEKIKALKPAVPFAAQITHIIVPDITVPGAYDEAVNGVRYIVHVASPLNMNLLEGADHEAQVIKPAVAGTLGMLESANKVTGVVRIVITASVLSIIGFPDFASTEILDETRRSAVSKGPFPNITAAYAASKARAFEASYEWMAEHKPSFDIINIEPVNVIGRDDTVTDPKEITKGTNGLVMGPLLGHLGDPMPGCSVHIDDVAMMHVKALDRSISGNQDFLANSNQPEGIEWSHVSGIVKKHFPKECAEGILNAEIAGQMQSGKLRVSAAKAEKAFGFVFKSLEEQVVSVVSHYLELLGRK